MTLGSILQALNTGLWLLTWLAALMTKMLRSYWRIVTSRSMCSQYLPCPTGLQVRWCTIQQLLLLHRQRLSRLQGFYHCTNPSRAHSDRQILHSIDVETITSQSR